MQKQKVAKNNNGEIYERIINHAPIGIVFFDADGNITSANEYFKKFLAEKHPVNKNIFKMRFFVREGLVPYCEKLLKKGVPFEKEDCASFDGLQRINIMAMPIKDEYGNINGAMFKLDNVNAELKKKVEEKTQQLEESLKLKSRFVSDASHELRTPLSIAKLNLEFFKKQFSGDNGHQTLEVLDAIDGEIDKIAGIISDISFFTSIDHDSSAGIMNLQRINLNDFLEDLCSKVKSLAGQKNINIIFKKNNSETCIDGDKIKLEKLFSNIIGNSIKYGREGGWVKISIDPNKKRKIADIIIGDNGAGIPEHDLPRIFERFYRSATSRNDGSGGFGLGLAVGKWIAEKHNGSIKVKSILNKGSVFTVTLPCH